MTNSPDRRFVVRIDGRQHLIPVEQLIVPSSSNLNWQSLNASHQMQVNHAYVLNSPTLLLLNLPITAQIGDRILLVGQGVGNWRITQNPNQQLRAGSVTTTIGITGRAESIDPSAQVEIVALSALLWQATIILGHLDLW
jgi:hypothetical protein